jgi:hypothetical protein
VAAVLVMGVVVAAAAVAWWTLRDSNDATPGLAPVGVEPFDVRGGIEPGPFRGGWSPDGTHLLTISARGVGEARRGRVRLITAPGSRAVDAAWLPGSNAVLVAEGPVPTGQLAVLRLDGSSLGVVPLRPSFGVGNGRGMAVDDAGGRAVVTRVERDPFVANGRTDLMLVDLGTGTTRPVLETAGTDEDHPVFVGPELVAFTSRPVSGGDGAVVVLDLSTNQVRVLSPHGVDATSVGAVADGAWVTYTADRKLGAVPTTGGPPVRLADVPSGASVTAVRPDGRAALVVEAAAGGASRLRRLTITPPPSAGGSGAEGYGGSPWRSTYS